MNKTFKKLFYFIGLSFFLQSCIFVPVIDSFKKAGLTTDDRKALLPQSVKKFHDAMTWTNVNLAMQYVKNENPDEIMNYLEDKAENEKVVESKVQNIKFDEDAYLATVRIKIRSYRVPVYVVNDRIEKQIWSFSLSDNWKLKEITDITNSKLK